MYLGQAINYLNPSTVKRFMVTSNKSIPEINLKPGNFRAFDRYDSALQCDIINREVISIDCMNNMINFEIE